MIDFFQTNSSFDMPENDLIDAELVTTDDVKHTLESVARCYRLHGFLVLTLPANTNDSLASHVLMTNWPEEMLEAYDAACLMRGSPVIERLRKATVPFAYDVHSTNRRRSDGKAGIALDLFQRFKLTSGAYFPAHLADGQRGAVAFGGSREALRQDEMLQLNAIANYIFNRLGRILKLERPAASSLSDRELECLYWAASGKTSGEMAGILELSEHTVNHYLNRAGRKLNAVNRVQAVAKAYRAGLIH